MCLRAFAFAKIASLYDKWLIMISSWSKHLTWAACWMSTHGHWKRSSILFHKVKKVLAVLAALPICCMHKVYPHFWWLIWWMTHLMQMWTYTVRSGAEERTFFGARLDILIFKLRSYHVLISYTVECSGPKFQRTLMFLGQAGTFLSSQAVRSSAKRSLTSDLTILIKCASQVDLQLICGDCMMDAPTGAERKRKKKSDKDERSHICRSRLPCQ